MPSQSIRKKIYPRLAYAFDKLIAWRLPFWERRRPGGGWMGKSFATKPAGGTPALPGRCGRSNLRLLFSKPFGGHQAGWVCQRHNPDPRRVFKIHWWLRSNDRWQPTVTLRAANRKTAA
ncbi:MAG: hypothetical protein WBN75_20205 [Verrucomicrobiia bacterium]